MYYDIFKNYYANTQEDNFYIIGNSEALTVKINAINVDPNNVPWNVAQISNGSTIDISPSDTPQDNIIIRISVNSRGTVDMKMNEVGEVEDNGSIYSIAVTEVPINTTWHVTKIINTEGPKLQAFPLENIDKMRDKVLQTPEIS